VRLKLWDEDAGRLVTWAENATRRSVGAGSPEQTG
jgi:hypothetical protein